MDPESPNQKSIIVPEVANISQQATPSQFGKIEKKGMLKYFYLATLVISFYAINVLLSFYSHSCSGCIWPITESDLLTKILDSNFFYPFVTTLPLLIFIIYYLKWGKFNKFKIFYLIFIYFQNFFYFLIGMNYLIFNLFKFDAYYSWSVFINSADQSGISYWPIIPLEYLFLFIFDFFVIKYIFRFSLTKTLLFWFLILLWIIVPIILKEINSGSYQVLFPFLLIANFFKFGF